MLIKLKYWYCIQIEKGLTYEVRYLGQNIRIKTMKDMKICGIWYCNTKEKEYKYNITDKIAKMESMLKLWRSRNLTFESM